MPREQLCWPFSSAQYKRKEPKLTSRFVDTSPGPFTFYPANMDYKNSPPSLLLNKEQGLIPVIKTESWKPTGPEKVLHISLTPKSGKV